MNLKDAYLTVPVHPNYQPYLRFVIEEVAYQFTCPPLQAGMCSVGLHQVDEGRADPTQVMGSQDGRLYQQNLGDGDKHLEVLSL